MGTSDKGVREGCLPDNNKWQDEGEVTERNSLSSRDLQL